jgi:proton-translocating NADH-quinone oxidoreductase chain M
MLLNILLTTLILGTIVLSFINNRAMLQYVSLFVSGLTLLISTYIFVIFDKNQTFFQEIVTYYFDSNYLNFSYSFGLDGLSVSFLFLSCFLIFLCILFIWDEVRFKEYVISLLVIELLLCLIFTVLDLFLFYIFFEGILIPMYLIIGVWGSRERKVRAVYLFFFYTLCSSILMLISILYIYSKVGSLNYELLLAQEFTFNEQLFIWFAFFFSFSSKIPMFPFHIWLPEAHVEAPTVGSVLLAGVLLKLGVYGFLRYSLAIFPEISVFLSPFVYSLSLIGIIYASFAALRQTDLKRIIAYSSIAHMSLVVLGLFSFHSLGIEGAILQSISHGFVAGGLFLLIGILYDRYHSRFLYYYGGLVHFMPLYSAIFLIFTMSNIALPGTSSFIGEFMILIGTYKTSIFVTILAALGVILSGTYSLWLYNRIIFGNIKMSYTTLFKDLTLREFLIMFPLIIFVFVLGLSPNVFLSYIHATAVYFFIN